MVKRRVLVVDDSSIFRRMVASTLKGMDGYEVVGQAADGVEALAFLAGNTVDLVTLDLEMPRMDGIACVTAMRQAGVRARVLVFSATSRQGADAALDAMSKGADEYAAKPDTISTGQSPHEAMRVLLTTKLAQFWGAQAPAAASNGAQANLAARNPVVQWSKFGAQAVVIASSTGGPVALEKLFAAFTRPFLCPVFLVQHMPPVFTASLAQRLSAVSGRTVREATHEQTPQAGTFYICPGDYHLRVLRAKDGSVKMLLDKGPLRNFVRPAADHLFESASQAYGRRCLGIVMTGMGADGRDGAVAIKKAAGAVAIQDQKTCAVFGMPKAVYDAAAYDFMGPAEELGGIISAAAG